MGDTLLYIISAVILVLILVILIITILKRRQKRYYQGIYDNLEREKNLIGSTPVLLELSKLEPIIKNEKMELLNLELLNVKWKFIKLGNKLMIYLIR